MTIDCKKWMAAGVILAGLMGGTALMAQTTALNAPATVKAIVAEHNRARTQPRVIAAEIKKEWDAMKKPASPTTTQAYETAIASLSAAAPIGTLTEDPELSRRATAWAEKLDKGGIANPHQNFAENLKGYSPAGENIFVNEEPTGVKSVRGFIVDDGVSNQGKYGHRVTIYNPAYKFIGVGLSPKGALVVLFGGSKAGDIQSGIKGTITATATGWILTTNGAGNFSIAYDLTSTGGSGGGSATATDGKFVYTRGAIARGTKLVVKAFPAGSTTRFADPKAYIIAEYTF